MLKLICLLLMSSLAQAALLRLDTSVLNPAQAWYLDFQLVDGDLTDNNTVTIEGQTLHNDQFFSQLLYTFVPTSELLLDIAWTSNFSGNGFADTFTWAVLDENFNSIVETGLGASLVVLLDGSTAELVAASATYNNVTPEFVVDASVPEPSTLWLVTGILPLAIRRARRSGRL